MARKQPAAMSDTGPGLVHRAAYPSQQIPTFGPFVGLTPLANDSEAAADEIVERSGSDRRERSDGSRIA